MQQIAQKARETEKIERARFERMLADEREEHAKSILRAECSIAERQAREAEEAEKRAQLRNQDEKDSMISMYDGDDNCSIRNKWDPVRFPHENGFNPEKDWTDQEIESMRANQWYRLCALLPKLVWMDVDNLTKITYAFKHEKSLTDDQRFWMIYNLYESICKLPMIGKTRYHLQETIRRKLFINPDEYEDMHTTWCQIKKMVHLYNPKGFIEWDKERRRDNRKAKALKSKSTDSYGILGFIQNAKHEKIKASILYEQYKMTNPLTILKQPEFGRILNRFGLISRKSHGIMYYTLNTDSVANFVNQYIN